MGTGGSINACTCGCASLYLSIDLIIVLGYERLRVRAVARVDCIQEQSTAPLLLNECS